MAAVDLDVPGRVGVTPADITRRRSLLTLLDGRASLSGIAELPAVGREAANHRPICRSGEHGVACLLHGGA